MSTLQHTKPRRANQSMTEESGLSGTVRSNVGCDAIDEPCTKRIAGLPSGAPANFSQSKRRTSPLCVYCPTPVTVFGAEAASGAVNGGRLAVCVRADLLISVTWVGESRASRRASI